VLITFTRNSTAIFAGELKKNFKYLQGSTITVSDPGRVYQDRSLQLPRSRLLARALESPCIDLHCTTIAGIC
jgi:hypothetical protein